MTPEEFNKVHEYYENNIDNWNFYGKAYEGGKIFIKESLTKNERESPYNYTERVRDASSFDYAKAIVDLFNFYLTAKEPIRTIGSLADDPLWQMFEKDCDLTGINFQKYMNDSQRQASIYGYVGILVNKASSDGVSVADALKAGVYPYCAQYSPQNVLDWTIERNKSTHRPELTFLKLKEMNGMHTFWKIGLWERWEYAPKKAHRVPKLIDSGAYPLDEIPFIFMPNIRSSSLQYAGDSDIKSIAAITASIIRNLSSGEEIIKFAGFPMLRKPMELDTGEDNKNDEDIIGLRAVQEFDPEYGDKGKPDWMPTEIKEPIDAILMWIDRKVDEAFRTAHLSGVHGQRKSNNEVASGLALRYEFQQLNSVLMQKSDSLSEAEMRVVKLWLKWQGKADWFQSKKMQIARSKNFSIDDLMIDLDNALEGLNMVASKTFHIAVQQSIAKKILPDLSDEKYEIIQKEIDTNTPEPTIDDGKIITHDRSLADKK